MDKIELKSGTIYYTSNYLQVEIFKDPAELTEEYPFIGRFTDNGMLCAYGADGRAATGSKKPFPLDIVRTDGATTENTLTAEQVRTFFSNALAFHNHLL